jgi:uncharacterized repeat protein (TIGR03803 family)
MLPATIEAQAFDPLYSFGGADGAYPQSAPILARDGNLYGTTSGGDQSSGTVFRITTAGALTTLYRFTGGADGDGPNGLIQARDGNLYGTTFDGGAYGWGTVFRITTTGTLTTLYSFTGGTDGLWPQTGLVQVSDGSLYGTTAYGGAAKGGGTVFRLTTGGKLKTLYSFSGADGSNANGLIQGKDGNLYGTTYQGGVYGWGTVFQLTTAGALTVLHNFSAVDGSNANGLIQGKDGNLYGTTYLGGAYNVGTVFQLTTAGALTTLHNFNGADGSDATGLIQAKDGNLYGTTCWGGLYNAGTVFRVTTNGLFTSLYSFTGGSDGVDPQAGLMQVSDSILTGTTYAGGAYGLGSLYTVEIVPILTGLSVSETNAAGPAFNFTLQGSLFTENSTVLWTEAGVTTALTTTYLATTKLKAAVPASLISKVGTATITVTNSGGSVSNPETFTVLLTTLKLFAAELLKTGSGNYTARISLSNAGYFSAPSVTITQATLGAATPSTTLPVSVGSITNGKAGSASLSFPSSAGSSGTKVTLSVAGTFTGGTFAGSLNVKLP